MAGERVTLRDWHRMFGLLLTDFFTGSPFEVAVEQDLSVQQQLLDVVIVRRRGGRFNGELPDGLEGLVAHNLITFKSHRETLDDWAMKELVGHYVAYRKFVSPSPSELVAENEFGLYAITARYPENLSGRVPWKQVQQGVYDCQWGTDLIRVVIAGELPREEQNAALHLFSAKPELVGYGGQAYQKRSEQTSRLLDQLFKGLRREGYFMPFTMEDFNRQYITEGLAELSPEDRQKALERLSTEERLAGLTPEQIQEYLDRMAKERSSPPRKSRRKK